MLVFLIALLRVGFLVSGVSPGMLIVDSQEEHRRIRHNTVVLSAFARTIPEVAWTHDTAMIIVFVGVCCVLGFDAGFRV